MLNKILIRNFSTLKKGGYLYTWGKSPNSLGYAVGKVENEIVNPTLVKELGDNKIVKVSMGETHSAVITEEGDLFTFGNGSFGELGHNDAGKSHSVPKRVEFFAKNNLKVKSVGCGKNFTAALTEDGDVWTWGKN
jgi:alpha-tubulin suppressor-like RCC1 family protein